MTAENYLNVHKQDEQDTKDLLTLAGEDPRPDDAFDMEELRLGMEEEMEHTNDKNIARVIAKDHLAENSQYYTRMRRLKEMGEF